MITFYFRKEKQKVYPNYTLLSIGDTYYFLFLNVENSNSFYIYNIGFLRGLYWKCYGFKNWLKIEIIKKFTILNYKIY